MNVGRFDVTQIQHLAENVKRFKLALRFEFRIYI